MFFFTNANAEVLLSDLWSKYNSIDNENSVKTNVKHPGRVIGQELGEGISSFNYVWKYRDSVYEIHFEDSKLLAKSIYGLALHSGDIDESLPKNKFINGVLGFHYSIDQVCSWLNDPKLKASDYDNFNRDFIEFLINDKIIIKKNNKYVQSGIISHVLGASASKKRSFDKNLNHERLHVYWDMDSEFRNSWKNKWTELTEDRQKEIKNKLKNYNSKNVSQLIEEWAIKSAESERLPLN